jgi:hypothetical protein
VVNVRSHGTLDVVGGKVSNTVTRRHLVPETTTTNGQPLSGHVSAPADLSTTDTRGAACCCGRTTGQPAAVVLIAVRDGAGPWCLPGPGQPNVAAA